MAMANPMFSAAWAAAVLIPTTRPERSTRGPPEFPGLMAASVWIKSSRVRTAPPGVPASIARPMADTIPEVTDGPPSRARAKPRATTVSPSPSWSESPSSTIGSPSASILSTARSALGSPPMARASKSRPSAVKTSMLRAPSTTWKLVTTTPSSRTMNPVPAPWLVSPDSGLGESRFVVTLTTAGRTRSTTAATGWSPARTGGSGEPRRGSEGPSSSMPPVQAPRRSPAPSVRDGHRREVLTLARIASAPRRGRRPYSVRSAPMAW